MIAMTTGDHMSPEMHAYASYCYNKLHTYLCDQKRPRALAATGTACPHNFELLIGNYVDFHNSF